MGVGAVAFALETDEPARAWIHENARHRLVGEDFAGFAAEL